MEKKVGKKDGKPEEKNTHLSFISKVNADQAERIRRLKKRQLQQIIEKNSKHAVKGNSQ
jgi:hypothetical protein